MHVWPCIMGLGPLPSVCQLLWDVELLHRCLVLLQTPSVKHSNLLQHWLLHAH